MPEVCKNFLGMSGARKRTSSRAIRSPLAAEASAVGGSPEANSSRMVPTDSITVTCPSLSAPGRVRPSGSVMVTSFTQATSQICATTNA